MVKKPRLPESRDGLYGAYGTADDVKNIISKRYEVPRSRVIVKHCPGITTRGDPDLKTYYWKVEKVRK